MIYKVIKEYKVDNDIIRAGETICSSDCVLEADSFLLENGFIEEVKENKRWRAAKCSDYFYVASNGELCSIHEHYDTTDDFRYLTGNYFKTKKEAQAYKNKLIATQRLTDIINEKNGDWVADWTDAKEIKWSIYFNYTTERYAKYLSSDGKGLLLIPHIKSQEICEEIIRDHKDLLDAINIISNMPEEKCRKCNAIMSEFEKQEFNMCKDCDETFSYMPKIVLQARLYNLLDLFHYEQDIDNIIECAEILGNLNGKNKYHFSRIYDIRETFSQVEKNMDAEFIHKDQFEFSKALFKRLREKRQERNRVIQENKDRELRKIKNI